MMSKFNTVAIVAAVAFAFAVVPVALAQDPANEWLGFMTGTGTGKRITSIEMDWIVPSDPVQGGFFFGIWFGIETSDNLNLVQPVLPYEDGWLIYNEYFQWEPTYNYNSRSHNVRAGDHIHGSVTYKPESNSYVMNNTCVDDGWSVTTEIPVQGSKVYDHFYVVLEKVPESCAQLPPSNHVVFNNIRVAWDNKVEVPTFKPSYVVNICDSRAHQINDTAVVLTWDSNASL